MGKVLRTTPRRADDTHPQRPTATAVPMATTARPLSHVPSEDYQTHRVAQPPRGLAHAWGQGCHREPCPPAPRLPQTDPQPSVGCGTTAFRKERLKGLSC